MSVTRAIVGVLILVLYFGIVVPFIAPYLLSLLADWLVSSDWGVLEVPRVTVKILENGTVLKETESITIDIKNVILFIAQAVVYFVAPIMFIISLKK